MDGTTLLRRLAEALAEETDSSWLDTQFSYELLWESAIELNLRARQLTGTQTITTVADQAGYNLNADFLEPQMRDGNLQYFVKYNDGTSDSFLRWRPYEEVYYSNLTTSVTVPSDFTIIDKATLPTQITGTATSVGAASGGQCTLTDTAANFTDVAEGDIVHNTTDGSNGRVLSVTSTTALIVALFGGTNNDWTIADAYIIQPQNRMQIVFEPPPSTAAHTVTVPYLKRPAPVFSDYGTYRFQQHFLPSLISYAAALYKYRGDQHAFADKFLNQWELNVMRNAGFMHKAKASSNRFRVNLKARHIR